MPILNLTWDGRYKLIPNIRVSPYDEEEFMDIWCAMTACKSYFFTSTKLSKYCGITPRKITHCMPMFLGAGICIVDEAKTIPNRNAFRWIRYKLLFDKDTDPKEILNMLKTLKIEKDGRN